MAVYLLNLGFSLNPMYVSNGAFMPYNPLDVGLAQSCAWFVPTVFVTPPSWGDVALPIPNLTPANWVPYPAVGSNSDNGRLLLSNLDYLCVRMFQADAPGSQPLVTNLRPTLVFGNATATSISGPNSAIYRQSPLTDSGNARSVVDFDNVASPATFPVPCTVESASNIPTTWAYCLGQIHALITDSHYSINVGATTWASSVGTSAVFGHDPIIKVKGSGSNDDGDVADE